MPDTTEIIRTLEPIDLPLAQIYLDPNNPRFTFADSVWVEDVHVVADAEQQRAHATLRRDFDVASLRMSIETNGYLPIDRIIVRQLTDNAYVVLEGNRRVAAAKDVARLQDTPNDIEPSVFASLESIPCLLYSGGDADASWVFQGIRHIQGILDWSPYHKARLLVDQMEQEDLTLTDVGRRFGLTPHGAGQWVRGFKAYAQAREESDYIDEIDHRAYTYFQELFSRSSANVREWIEWDEDNYKFANLINLNEFVSWLYPRPGDDIDDDDETTGRGDWDKRIIRSREDIRQIAAIRANDPALFHEFRQTHDLKRAYQQYLHKQIEQEEARKDAAEVLFAALDNAIDELDEIPFKIINNAEQREHLQGRLERLEQLIAPLKQ